MYLSFVVIALSSETLLMQFHAFYFNLITYFLFLSNSSFSYYQHNLMIATNSFLVEFFNELANFFVFDFKSCHFRQHTCQHPEYVSLCLFFCLHKLCYFVINSIHSNWYCFFAFKLFSYYYSSSKYLLMLMARLSKFLSNSMMVSMWFIEQLHLPCLFAFGRCFYIYGILIVHFKLTLVHRHCWLLLIVVPTNFINVQES